MYRQHSTDSSSPADFPTSLSPPQQFPEPGVGTQVYTTAPLELTFPEDPSYGSGLKRIHNFSSQTISELYLFSLVRPREVRERRVSKEASQKPFPGRVGPTNTGVVAYRAYC